MNEEEKRRLGLALALKSIREGEMRDAAKVYTNGVEHNKWPHSSVGPFVYVVGNFDVDAAKIGTSANPKRRIADFRLSSPVPLSVLALYRGGEELEHELHERFAEERLHGEWFKLSGALMEYLARMAGESFVVDEL